MIRSTLEIPEARRADLRKTLQERFSSQLELRFETVPDLISGIECRARLGIGLERFRLPGNLGSKREGYAAATEGSGMSSPAESLQGFWIRPSAALRRPWKNPSPLRAARGGLRALTGIAKVTGLPGVGLREELLRFPGDLFGIAFNVEEDEIGVVLLGEYEQLRAGGEVPRAGQGYEHGRDCWDAS